MQSVMGGPDPMDPWTPHAEPLGRVSPALLSQDLSGLRIGFLSRTAATKVSADVAAGVEASLRVFKDLGAEIEEVNTDVDWMSEDQRALYLRSIGNGLGHLVDRYGDKTDPVLQAYVVAGRKYDIAAYIKASAARTRLFRAVQGLFEMYDFLVSPTLTRTAVSADLNGLPTWWRLMARPRVRRSPPSPDLSTRSISPATRRSLCCPAGPQTDCQ
jgi:aspartyl-tRNA(Asn)/glutamyl-tRNA(Gln) amidotransferase subunit A